MEGARQKTIARTATAPPASLAKAAEVRSAAWRPGVAAQAASWAVSSPKDPAEREADATAKKVMRMAAPTSDAPSPSTVRFSAARALLQRQRDGGAAGGEGEGQARVPAPVQAEIQRSAGSGAALPAGARGFMEPRFRADFSKVRVHTGDRAAALSRQLNARAFTVGNQIFFGKDQFRPDTHEGRELLAHELTHTIQQGAAVQRSEDVTVTQATPPQVQRGLFDLDFSGVLNFFADAANAIPGFRMFTLVIGVNPINQSRVDRSAANLLRAVVEFMPGGNLITRALDAYGVFDRVGAWIEGQLDALGISGASIRRAIDEFLGSLGVADIARPGSVWGRARRIFADPADRIIRFVGGLAAEVLRIIKDAILRPLAGLASRTRGWDLLCAVLGRNPITGDAVPRSAETLIGGFMRLIGQEEIWQNIQRANAIPRAWAWFQTALDGLMGFVREIPQLFVRALQELRIDDVVALPTAFARVAGVFGDFIGRFLSWAGGTIWNLLEIIFAVVAPGAMVYLRRAAGAFRTILQNPIGFVGNLVRAGMMGLRQFATNFLTHLRASLIGWLTGAMSGANLYIPQGFNLREILKFVLSVLGLTWQNVRQKLVRATSETAVRAMEVGFDIVMTLVTEGPAAAWQKILEQLTNLRDMVIEQVMTFVRDRIVTAAITRLVSMLNPAGAFIQAIIAIYNTVMFFVERLQQIMRVAMSFIDSIAAIASGSLGAAANRVEQTMAGLLTLVISFLARIAGLGRVSDAVTNVINRVRQPIDRALDRVVEWVVAQARRLLRAGRSLAGRLFEWWRARKPFTARDGKPHALFFKGERQAARVHVASTERPVPVWLGIVQQAVSRLPGDAPEKATAPGKVARAAEKHASIEAIERSIDPSRPQPYTEEEMRSVNGRIDALFVEIGTLLSDLFPLIEEDADESAVRRRVQGTAQGRTSLEPSRFAFSYGEGDMKLIVKSGLRLSVAEDVMADMVFVGSRADKRLGPAQLAQQMQNWATVIAPRGYPYWFESQTRFLEWKERVKALLERFDVTVERIEVQGSSLRKPTAKDIDVTAHAMQAQFDQAVENAIEGFVEGAPPGSTSKKAKAVRSAARRGKLDAYAVRRKDITGSGELADFKAQLRDMTRTFSRAVDVGMKIVLSNATINVKPGL